MTVENSNAVITATAEDIESGLAGFIGKKIKAEVDPGQDLFASGLVSSMFAMQLVVHLESTYDIAIIGPDLKLDNFRTINAMTRLVLRLRSDLSADANG